MTYRAETRTVYITEDGQEFIEEGTAKRHSLKHRLENLIGYSPFYHLEGLFADSKDARDAVRELLATYDDPKPAVDDGWIEWDCNTRSVAPVSDGTLVEYKLRRPGHPCKPLPARDLRWHSFGPDFAENDIVAYRVISD